MALRISQTLCFVLWLSLLFVVFLELYNFKNRSNIIIKKEISSSITSYSSSSSSPSRSRKVLASNFDFTPFHQKHRHQQQHQHHDQNRPPDQHGRVQVHKGPAAAGGSEIDPRYGVEKRLVPTGPNPLHH